MSDQYKDNIVPYEDFEEAFINEYQKLDKKQAKMKILLEKSPKKKIGCLHL